MENNVLQILIKVKDDASASIQKITSSLGGLGTAALTAGAALGAITLGAAIKEFTDFESAMKQSIAIMGNVSKEMEEALGRKALELANNMAVSQEEVAKAYYYLASAGLSAKESLEAVTSVAKLSIAAHMDMAEATNIAVGAMKGFGLEVEDLSRINDVLIATVTKSNTNLQQLGEALKYLSPAANAVGWSIEEMSAAVGLLANHNIKGAQSGVYLRQVIAQLLDPTSKMKEVLQRLGLTYEDVNPKTHSFTEILQKLTDAGADATDIMQMFGVRAGTAVLALMQDGVPALQAFNQELQNSAGITDEVRKKQEEAFGEQLKILKNNIRSLAITVGQELMPPLREMVEMLREFVTNEEFKNSIREFGVGAKEGLSLAVEALKLFLEVLNRLPPGLTKTLGKLTALLVILTPLIVTLKVVGSVLGSLTGLFGGLSGVISIVSGAISSIIGVLSTLGTAIATVVGAISLGTAAIIGAIVGVIAIIAILVTNWHGARDKVKAALISMKNAVIDFSNTAITKISDFVSKFKTKLSELKPAVSSITSSITYKFKEAFNRIIGAVRTFGSQIKSMVSNIGRSIVSGILSGLRGLRAKLRNALVNPVKDAINEIKRALGIHSPSKVFKEIGMNIVIGYQEGLNLAKTIKPELPMPEIPKLSPTPITNTYNTQKSVKFEINLHGVAIREDKDIDELVYKIEERLGRRLSW